MRFFAYLRYSYSMEHQLSQSYLTKLASAEFDCRFGLRFNKMIQVWLCCCDKKKKPGNHIEDSYSPYYLCCTFIHSIVHARVYTENDNTLMSSNSKCFNHFIFFLVLRALVHSYSKFQIWSMYKISDFPDDDI